MDSRKLIYILAGMLLLNGAAIADTGDRVERRFDERGDPGLGVPEHGVVGVAEVDRERGARRHDIDQVGVEVEAPHRGDLGRGCAFLASR